MPIYEYQCNNCNESFTKHLAVDSRDDPVNEPCIHCDTLGSVTRPITSCSVQFQTFITNNMLDTDFKSTMKAIKKGAGKNNNIPDY